MENTAFQIFREASRDIQAGGDGYQVSTLVIKTGPGRAEAGQTGGATFSGRLRKEGSSLPNVFDKLLYHMQRMFPHPPNRSSFGGLTPKGCADLGSGLPTLI